MTALLPWERLGSKVCNRHLERLAVVYVRQSTRQQVLDHGESTRLQYGLVERAVALGWQISRVLVIDEDLGKSGPARPAGRGSSGWSPRSPWGMWGWCWASRCRCWPTPTASTTRWSSTTGCCWGREGTMSEAELHLPEAADAGRQAGQGTAGGAGDRAADRLCAPPLRRGDPGPRRAGPNRGAAGVRQVRRARHAARGAAFDSREIAGRRQWSGGLDGVSRGIGRRRIGREGAGIGRHGPWPSRASSLPASA